MKRLRIGFALLVLLVSFVLRPTAFAASEDEDMPYAASSKEYDLSYEDIISLYRLEFLSLNEDRDHVPHRLFNDLIWMDEYSCDLAAIKAEIGYALKDINGDGTEELLIGRSPAYINEVFTIRNGKTKELLRAGYRYDCCLLDDDTLYRTGSNGAVFYSSELYRMDDTGAIVFVKGYSQDGEYAYEHGMGDDEEAWFSMPDAQTIYGSDMPEHLVETKEARDWIESCESHFADIPFTLLFKDKQDEFTGVVTVKGKQTGNDKVRIRRTPDRKGKILASLKVGTKLTVTGEENGYYRVKLPEGEGYILKEFLVLRDAVPEEQSKRPDKPDDKETATPEPTETPQFEPAPPTDAGNGEAVDKPDKAPIYETVIDHYETVEVQRTRQVIDHYETYYTYSDNGDGTFSEEAHERPVYTTEYYTETVEQPVYKQVLKED